MKEILDKKVEKVCFCMNLFYKNSGANFLI